MDLICISFGLRLEFKKNKFQWIECHDAILTPLQEGTHHQLLAQEKLYLQARWQTGL